MRLNCSIIIDTAKQELTSLSDCTCPGHELKLLCTVVGAGFTQWRVNDCSIRFRHSQFIEGGEAGHCNGRQIVGHWRERYGQNVTTELTILASSTLSGTNVECTYDNGLEDVSIGRYTISFRTGIYA